MKSGLDDEGTIYIRTLLGCGACGIVVAECTQVSLGVGYELAYDEAHGKEVHIFYHPKETQLSAMLTGNERFNIHRYADEVEILTQVRQI